MRAINMKIEQIKETITIVKDYPIKGIVFKDITTLLENPDAFKSTVDIMVDKVKHLDFNRVVGVESRGFFWSGPIAYALSKSFVLARKPGKLPNETYVKSFDLEYGSTSIEIQKNTNIEKGQRVVIIDDLVATGGTAIACAELLTENFNVEKSDILILCIIDLPELGGSNLIKEQGYNIETLVSY